MLPDGFSIRNINDGWEEQKKKLAEAAAKAKGFWNNAGKDIKDAATSYFKPTETVRARDIFRELGDTITSGSPLRAKNMPTAEEAKAGYKVNMQPPKMGAKDTLKWIFTGKAPGITDEDRKLARNYTGKMMSWGGFEGGIKNVGGIGGNVPLGNLKPYHNDIDPKAVADYMKKIAKGEKVDPVRVFDEGNGQYGIIDGHHRTKAYELLGIKDVPVVFTTAKADAKMAAQQLASKGKEAKIVYMSPDEYLQKAYKQSGDTGSFNDYIKIRTKADEYAAMMRSGTQFNMPVIGDGVQEGANRALAAKKVGIAKIPVVEISKPKANIPQGIPNPNANKKMYLRDQLGKYAGSKTVAPKEIMDEDYYHMIDMRDKLSNPSKKLTFREANIIDKMAKHYGIKTTGKSIQQIVDEFLK